MSQGKHSAAFVLLLFAVLLGCVGVSLWIVASPDVADVRDAQYTYCEKSLFLRNLTRPNVTWPQTRVADRFELANMLSSLCFMFGPIFLVTYYFRKLNVLAFFFGVYQLFHALGTFTNHACGCQFGYMWDNAGVWSMLAYMITVNVLALLPRQACHPSQNSAHKTRHQCRAFMAVSNLCLTALFVGLAFLKTSAVEQGVIQGVLFVTLVVLGSILVGKKNVSTRGRNLFIAAVVSLVIGVAFAIMDGPLCYTPSFGFHVLWHMIGGALAMVFYTVFLMEVMIKIES